MQVTQPHYRDIALSWSPATATNQRLFLFITLLSAMAAIVLAAYIHSVQLPPTPRKQPLQVPERVAQYIAERPKPKPTKPKPPPPPPPKPKPKVAREQPNKQQQPLNKAQKAARKKAEKTGLLALGGQLAGLVDTSAVDGMLATKTKNSPQAQREGDLTLSGLKQTQMSQAAEVNSSDYMPATSHTQLSAREKAQLQAAVFAAEPSNQPKPDKPATDNASKADTRTQESIALTFDKNKGTLYALYNRERRKNPSIRGKIIFELIINAEGKVTKADILSSELNAPSLEQRLLARIKTFNFGKQKVNTITITFPVEFLPA